MATIGQISSTPTSTANEKPVIVRVKRKSFQSRVDALWVEINERPSKRAALDLEKLTLSDSVNAEVEEYRAKKVFVKHVETVTSSQATMDIVQSFVTNSGDVVERKVKSEERKWSFKEENASASNARFEQIWRGQRGNTETSSDKALHDVCHFYDVVRVDVEERSNEVKREEISLEEQRILSSYLPLLREFIPGAAAEFESSFHGYIPEEDYVYDYYTLNDDMDIDAHASSSFPLVQVEDEDYYDGPEDESEYDTDDSNAERHPLNEYPDEPSEEEDEEESESSASESDEESDAASNKSSEVDKHGEDGNGTGDEYYDVDDIEDYVDYSDGVDDFVYDSEDI